MLDDFRRKHVLELAEERSRPPERDAEVVQELGVEVRAQARLVCEQDADERAMDRPGAGFGAHVRREVDLERWRAPGDAGMLKDDALDAVRARRDAGSALDHRFQPLVGVFVAAESGQRHDGRQWLPRASRRRPSDVAGFDAQARDGLVAVVEDVEQRSVLLGVSLRQQPPHADHGRHFLLERTRRQVPREVHGLRQAHGQRRAPVAWLPRHDCRAAGA